MINKFILPLLAVLLLGSCANKFSLVKRKYNKGYHFAMSKKHSSPKENNVGESKEQVAVMEPKTSVLPSGGEKEIKAYSLQATNPAVKEEVKKPVRNSVVASASALPLIKKRTIQTLNSRQVEILKNELEKSKASDGDVKLIILVILAILLPPLAVYLKDNSINKWFWITLILCLLSFSVFFFVFGGLTYLIAIIIALMYVLGAL